MDTPNGDVYGAIQNLRDWIRWILTAFITASLFLAGVIVRYLSKVNETRQRVGEALSKRATTSEDKAGDKDTSIARIEERQKALDHRVCSMEKKLDTVLEDLAYIRGAMGVRRKQP